ncbi:nuclear transport factor 2 [Rhizoctonia solani]|uniref:Nuclear transport factor 2 n=1 Tax=Rhizoctonia solani TaxID=456999 RepID=A0A8H8NVG6_9AGAM|nr:nuclear transport factor 2 [Rhizoctonia solani]QRW19146.1 nuclear transport factor 2 [Rhizoctonia solani]
MASPAPNAQAKSTVVPSEVGWQFVSQYYTYVNKEPSKLHCFYTKHSTYTHGVEGEDSPPCHGQQEIHNKIISIGFQDCKVFIHSVDAQSSASSGILIQVIGEISNAGEAWRKFSQSFFLAEQPNGYFVLNDIFRYLKEETNADDEVSSDKEEAETGEEAAVEPTAATQLHDVPEHPVAQPEPEPVVSLPPAAPQETAAPEPAPDAPAVNGTHVEEKTPEPAKETTQLPSPSPEPEPQPAEEPAPAEPAPTPTPAPAPAPAPAPTNSAPAASPAPPAAEKPQVSAAPPSAPPAPTQPAQPPAPPAPKTWANLAATNVSGWGQVSSGARGVSAPAKPATPTPKPAAPAPAPVARKEEPPIDTSNLSPQAQAALSVNTPQCFVKLNDWVRDNAAGNQTQSNAESVSPAALKEVLTARFGAIKELEVVRTKACAFLEFVQVDSARRAILASLPTNQGGEGGIRIGEDTPNERAPRITVEMRKERGDRPMSGGRPRTGGPEQRGSFRGRGGRGRGDGTRGGAPQAAK